MTARLLALACLLLLPARLHAQQAQPAPEDQQVLFVMNHYARTADGGSVAGAGPTVLGALFDTNVARFVPGVDASAVKIHATPEVAVLTGDIDEDGDFWEVHWGDIDALGLRRFAPAPATLTTPRLVFSTQQHWGGALPSSFADFLGARAGTLFSVGRDADGALRVAPFLREWLLLSAVGQAGSLGSDGVDVDAFAQDDHGNVYLSFRHPEPISGQWLGPGGVVCLPAPKLVFDGAGNVVDLFPSAAAVLLTEPEVDALVSAAGLTTASGLPIDHIGNLQALALDPGGGWFAPSGPVPGLGPLAPHLLFNGEQLGATVLTTAGGGRIARVNDRPLGHVPINGSALGLDPGTTAKSHDLNGLEVWPWTPAQMCLDVSDPQVELPDRVEFALGGATPGGPVLMAYAFGSTAAGSLPTLAPALPSAIYPMVVAEPWARIDAATADGSGRVLAAYDVTLDPELPLLVLAQALDVTRQELSPPALLWCP